MANVPYIQTGGYSLVRNPFLLREVAGFGFAVAGNFDLLTSLCDKALNHTANVRYRPYSRTVLFTFMNMARLSSVPQPDCDRGTFRERELNITIPLVEEEKIMGVWVPQRLLWYMPWLWVDSSAALIAGREIYGFPKQYGAITMPTALGQPASFRLDAEVLQRFAPTEQAVAHTILTVRRTDAPGLDAATAWETFEVGLAELFNKTRLLEDPLVAVTGALLSAVSSNPLVLIFLRQLASIADSSRACYQSVAEASFDLTRFGSMGLLDGDYELTIPECAGAPLARQLGLPVQNGTSVIQPFAAFYVDIDFRLNAGRGIWVAS